MKVACVQPFFNELDLLELKLEILKDVVDVFMVVESPVTFTGICKPLYFDENRSRFERFKIEHVVVKDMPYGPDPWKRENHQRKVMDTQAFKLAADHIIWTDTDECPRPEVVEKFAQLNIPMASIEMDQLLYYFDRLWFKIPKIRVSFISQGCNQLPGRNNTNIPLIRNGGWHFEYFGSREILCEKVSATSHAIEVGSREFWRKVYDGEKPSLNETTEYTIESLPDFVRKNVNRFASQFSVPPKGGSGGRS